MGGCSAAGSAACHNAKMQARAWARRHAHSSTPQVHTKTPMRVDAAMHVVVTTLFYDCIRKVGLSQADGNPRL
eukprot:360457-Chlamydomonas_euryale.AAC.7